MTDSDLIRGQEICHHCLQMRDEHAKNKCLYMPTYFTPVRCSLCDKVFTRRDNPANIVGPLGRKYEHFKGVCP